MFARPLNPGALWHLGNCNLTWESPQISTSWLQTPDKGIVTLSGKYGTQEVLKLDGVAP